MGCKATSGLSAIDYRIFDPYLDPAGDQRSGQRGKAGEHRRTGSVLSAHGGGGGGFPAGSGQRFCDLRIAQQPDQGQYGDGRALE